MSADLWGHVECYISINSGNKVTLAHIDNN